MPNPKGWRNIVVPEQIYEKLRGLSVMQRIPIWRVLSPFLPAMTSAFLDAHYEEIKVLQEKLKNGEALNEILSRPDSYYTMLDGVMDLKSEIIEAKAKKEIEEAEEKGGAVDIWSKKTENDKL